MSWIQYNADTEFPIQNLPFGVAYKKGNDPATAVCVTRLGDYVVSLSALQQAGLLLPGSDCFSKPYLNDFMAMGKNAWTECRTRLTQIFAASAEQELRKKVQESAVIEASQIAHLMPCKIGDYTDFYASIDHASNMGKIFRPGQEPLKPNWRWMPVGYHGRASSVVVSPYNLKRPWGQIKPKTADKPHYGKCGRMDYELEMAVVVGTGNELGQPIPIADAKNKIFGVALLNDWSARDIQGWEYVPLGPFNGKNLGTTISPWLVTLDALAPFLCKGQEQVPPPLSYLEEAGAAHYDIKLRVQLTTAKLSEPFTICESNGKYLYWSWSQMLAHHTVTGCNMRPGDMFGTGTISGPSKAEWGSINELSWAGRKPFTLPNGETRTFLEDGDTITITGYCQGDGYRIGFGSATGSILPADDKAC